MSGPPPFDRWLARFDDAGGSLRLYRAFLAAWILAAFVPTGQWLKEAPSALLFPPLGTPLLFGSVPQGWVVDVVTIALASGAALLLFGLHARTAALGVAASLLVLFTWSYSFGKIDHSILIVLTPALLAFSGWGRVEVGGEADGVPTRPAGWLPAFLAIIIGLAMLSAAIPKVASGWASSEGSAVRYHFLQNHYVTERSAPLTDLFLGLDSAFFWQALDYSTIGLELLVLLAVVSLRSFRIALACAALFHLGVWLLMDILFVTNLVAYAAFVRWEGLYRFRVFRLVAGEEGAAPRWLAPALVVAGGAYGAACIGWENPLTAGQVALFGQPVLKQTIMISGGVLAMGYLVLRLLELLSLRRSRSESGRLSPPVTFHPR